MNRYLPLFLLYLSLSSVFATALSPSELRSAVTSNDVVWDAPGRTSADSMPIGNGDIGLNVWTEENGDIVFYIGKTDAWSENPKGTCGLAKVGKIRLSISPTLFSGMNGFSQALHLFDGEMMITGSGGSVRLWVDANAPVIHLQCNCKAPSILKVSLDPYRAVASRPANGATNSLSQFQQPDLDELKADYHSAGLKDRLAWCHFDGTSNALGKPTSPEVVNWGFGALIQGHNMVAGGVGGLTSDSSLTHEVAITVASGRASSDRDWIDSVLHAEKAIFEPVTKEQMRAHADWWHAFWDRSYLFVGGTPEARKVTQGYILQRFVTACAGRGAWPVKFNGSLFVIDWPALSFGKDKTTGQEIIRPVTADYRAWGCLLYTSPSPRDRTRSRMPSSA